MNESMLTGESIPVIKTAIQPINQPFNSNDENFLKKNIIFSGTKLIQAKKMGTIPSETTSPNSEGKELQGLVLKTGYVTRKGGLVRDILYPK